MPPQRPVKPITVATIVGLVAFILPIAGGGRLYLHTGSVKPLLFTLMMSLVTFLLYGHDKRQSRNSGWRVEESMLHLFGLLGGWPGALVGQHFFQHKTTKKSFQITFWGIVVVHQIGWWAVLRN